MGAVNVHRSKDSSTSGRTLEEYLVHAIDLADIHHQLRAVYVQRGQRFRVGIGSICRRGRVSEIRRIVAGIAAVLPGIPSTCSARNSRSWLVGVTVHRQ
jgi:hypothetical protein